MWVFLGSLYLFIKKYFIYKNIKFFNFLHANNALIAHLGVGLLILGITFSSVYQKEYQANINVGEELKLGNYKLRFKDINIGEGKNFQNLTANFLLFKKY